MRLGSATRQHGVFFRFYEWRPPKRHDGIADEFINDAVVFLNRQGLQLKVSVEQCHHEQWGQPFRQAREPDQIGEQYGHIAPAAGYCLRARLCEHVLQYSWIDILAKDLLHLLFGAQFFYEKIKGIGQSPHLVSRTNWQLYIEIALLNIAHGGGQRPHGSAKTACYERCHGHA